MQKKSIKVNIKSNIKSLNKMPAVAQLDVKNQSDVVIFYDKKLYKNKFIQTWLKPYANKVALNAGESLKTLNSYAQILKKISTLPIHKKTVFVALGGGSVGDFVGFLASTYHRGQKLVIIPSTWLAAIDSAHGGKNGLNFLNTKNQIGTFYCPDKIIFVKPLLMAQPQQLVNEAFGETFKIGIINRPKILSKPKISSNFLWKNLSVMVSGKYAVVNKDPLEKSGVRQILNLGHTMGHVFESVHKISHGEAVLLGMLFAARYSYHLEYLSQKEFIFISRALFLVPLSIKYSHVLKIADSKIKQLLLKDKKINTSEKLNYIFIHKIGSVFVREIKISDLLQEIQRQRRQL